MEGAPALNVPQLCPDDPLETLGTSIREQESYDSSRSLAMASSTLDGSLETVVAVPTVFESPLRAEVGDEQEQMSSPCVRTLRNVETMEGNFEAGYDSDGLGPPKDNEVEDFEESAVRERGIEDGIVLGVGETQPNVNTTPRHILIPADAFAKLTVAQLKHELFIRGVQFRGQSKKVDLQERLKEALNSKIKVTIFGSTSNALQRTKKDDLIGFHPSSYWELLEPGHLAEEPVNTHPNARAPTQQEGEPTPVKYNFDEIFDRPVFLGKKVQFQYQRNGRKKLDKDGMHEFRRLPRKTLSPRRDFLRKHHLSKHSDPVEFMDAFFPLANSYDVNGFSLAQMTTFTNMKATMGNAGKGGKE